MRLLITALGFLIASPLWAFQLPEPVVTEKEMIVTANPLASAAGAQVLKAGGSAVDAMIAAQTVLSLVEPQSSGIGGGAFVVYYDASTGKTTTYDAREKAPSAATPGRFLDSDGEPLAFVEAWQSGLSVGVPGVPRLLEVMHERYGKLPWKGLFEPAIALAQQGFELTARTSTQVNNLLAKNDSCTAEGRLFFRDPTAFHYFVNPETCTAKPPGTEMHNPAYGKALELISKDGAGAFYDGPVATDIVTAVTSDPHIPGDMTKEDLASYQVQERAPVCIEYRGYNVCGMGPPSSGGLAVGQILGILENFELGDLPGPLTAKAVHLFTQAGRLAFADRNAYVADSDFVTVPAEGMLNKTYLAKRATLITDQDMGKAEPGTPPGKYDPTEADARAKTSGTSHISVVDQDGNALSMTTSVESSFGNGVMVKGWGFLLNNQLTDFSFVPTTEENIPVANRVEPGKRPRSSMSPTLVFDGKGKIRFVTGSPGGSRIIGYTAQSVINLIDFELDPQEAINVPHYMNRNGKTELEAPIPTITVNYDAEALAALLAERGHDATVSPLTSGLSVIAVEKSRYVGGRDLRRDGAVGGR